MSKAEPDLVAIKKLFGAGLAAAGIELPTVPDPSHTDAAHFQANGCERLTGWRWIEDFGVWICMGRSRKKHQSRLVTFDGKFKFWGR
jgi:hypothetical protein